MINLYTKYEVSMFSEQVKKEIWNKNFSNRTANIYGKNFPVYNKG